MIGKYERGDNSPSIEAIVKLVKASFGVSVDYLLGEGVNAAYDMEMVGRLDELESLPAEEKQRIYHYMDSHQGLQDKKNIHPLKTKSPGALRGIDVAPLRDKESPIRNSYPSLIGIYYQIYSITMLGQLNVSFLYLNPSIYPSCSRVLVPNL
ncbi:helix-turn-helix domain-containing protein [Lunatimonas salinarum]|uniref:helix-turn-helix domain-containing protein n=1 Tax=Lunatimonas salinarum TaxID=1774590 RepID=UPI001FD7319E|nr:helix-turn-helix transcriptional regulator [Lunatimonas salinarum]